LEAAERAGADEKQRHSVVQRALTVLRDLKPGETPPEIAQKIHGAVREEVSAADPYREAKAADTRRALELYPRLKDLVAGAQDQLGTAVRLSIAGNIIDLGVGQEYADLWESVERALAQPLAIDDQPALRDRLADADHVLFIGDNAGETVFDRVLIETLSLPVIYAVKGGPVLNDATMEDAVEAGLDQCSTLVSTGSDAPGTILSLCSEEFRRRFAQAPVIIAKGHGNYESLSEEDPRVFCLLQVKCPVIGRDIGVPSGSIVVRQSRAAGASSP
jgi:uncharacterized protein with ATP-grasp and redox domains